jgi:hypothetical protein
MLGQVMASVAFIAALAAPVRPVVYDHELIEAAADAAFPDDAPCGWTHIAAIVEDDASQTFTLVPHCVLSGFPARPVNAIKLNIGEHNVAVFRVDRFGNTEYMFGDE